jgi:hypothetical protein
MADDTADPRVVEQSLRKGEVEIRKLEAETRTAEVTAMTPTLPGEIPSGKLDPGNRASPIGTVGAYGSLDAIASRIASVVPQGAKVRISSTDVVTRERAVNAAVSSTLSHIETDLASAENLLVPTRGVLPVGALAAMSFAAAAVPLLGSLMRSNVSVRSSDITISFRSAAAAIARELLKRSNGTIVLDGAPLPASGALLAKAHELQRKRDALALAVAKYRVEHVDEPSPDVAATAERLAAIKAFSSELAKKKEQASEMEDVIALVENAARTASEKRRLFAEHAGRVSMVTKVVDDVSAALNALMTANTSGLSAIDVAEAYEANKDAHVLLLEAAYAGAESIYEEKVGKDRGLHVGAAVVSYVLLDPTSSVVGAGNVSAQLAAKNKLGSTDIEWGTAAICGPSSG